MRFSITGLRTIEEVAVLEEALRRHREGQPKAELGSQPKEGRNAERFMNIAKEERAGRILKGLTNPSPLPPVYHSELRALYEANSTPITLEQLAEKVGESVEKVKAHLSKLSGRMSRIATAAERKSLITPFLLLADIESTPGGSKQYRLTPAGRIAIARLLAVIS